MRYLLGLALIACGACGGNKATTFIKPRLAIEFPAPADGTDRELRQFAVPVDSGVGTEIDGHDLRPLPGIEPGPVTLALNFEDRGNRVAATVYILPPESDPLRWADGHKRLLGAYSAPVNGTIELRELQKLGYQPISLKVVKAAPPVHAHPDLISRVPSIKMDFAEDDAQSYMAGARRDTEICTVTLSNLSSHGIVAYILSGSGEESNFLGKPVIPAGAQSKKITIEFSSSFKETPQGKVKLPAAPQQVILAAALFDNGSHEGDDRLAAKLKAQQIGFSMVNRRLAPVIDRIVRDKTINDEVRTARIKDEIFHLSSQPDQATIELLQKQFPNLPAMAIVQRLAAGFDDAKNFLWGDLYGYMHNCCQYPPRDQVLVADWWHSTRNLIEPLLRG